MRRIILLVTVALVMAVGLVLNAGAAFADVDGKALGQCMQNAGTGPEGAKARSVCRLEFLGP
jgi:hypothetical protein